VPTITNTNNVSAKTSIEILKSTGCGDDTNLQTLLEAFIESQNAVITYALGMSGANCSALQNIFKTNTSSIDANSLLYGFKNNGCAGLTPLQVFQYMLTAGVKDATTKSLFCSFVSSCGAGLTCEIIDFNLVTNPHSSTCSNIVGISGSWQ
jgi:hypothetical protein